MQDQKLYHVPHPQRQRHTSDARPPIYGERYEEIPTNKCDRCGEEVQLNWRFCGFCGHCLRNCG